jgi:uracil-DNA glycosylase family 4
MQALQERRANVIRLAEYDENLEVCAMSYDQASQLTKLEADAPLCTLCMSFPPQKKLKNVILGRSCADIIDFWPGARQPLPPPNHLLMLGQDYGTEGLWYQIREGQGKTEEGQAKFVIREGKRMYNSPTMKNLEYLLRSIGLGFGDVFLANVILCARSPGGESGGENINVEKAMKNCCIKGGHLRQLINIVRPLVIVTLGGTALHAIKHTLESKDIDVPPLPADMQLSRLVKRLSAHEAPDLQVHLPYRDRPVSIVPLFHPAARPKDRTLEQQEGDYQRLRKVLGTF